MFTDFVQLVNHFSSLIALLVDEILFYQDNHQQQLVSNQISDNNETVPRGDLPCNFQKCNQARQKWTEQKYVEIMHTYYYSSINT